jgi:hypothetical protein
MNEKISFEGVPMALSHPHYIYQEGCGTPIGKISGSGMKSLFKVARHGVKRLHRKHAVKGGFLGALASVAVPLVGSFVHMISSLIKRKHHDKHGSGLKGLKLISKDRKHVIDIDKNLMHYKTHVPREIRHKLKPLKKITGQPKRSIKQKKGGAIGFGMDSQVIYQ